MGGYREDEPDRAEQHEYAAHTHDIAVVRPTDALVDDCFYYQRHKKLQYGLKHFEKRSEHAFGTVPLEVYREFFHFYIILCLFDFNDG